MSRISARRRCALLIVPILLVVSWMATTAAPVPDKMNHQGRLTDNSPSQVPIDGLVSITFRIFGSLAGSDLEWEENWPAVQVNHGIYSVLLGDNGTPLPASVFSTAPRYLEIVVDGEVLTPRQELATVGWAHLALDSVTVGGKNVDYFQKRVAGVCASGSSIREILVDGTVVCETDDQGIAVESDPQVGALTSDSVPRWDGAALVDGSIADAGSGRVGIGVASPSAELDVGGVINAELRLSVEGTWTSDCCSVHGSPGCDDPVCEAAVCAMDMSCCTGSWTQPCLGFSVSGCENVCASGDSTVSLPDNSISAAEIRAESGAVTAINDVNGALLSGMNVLASTTIEAPWAGYALVVGNASMRISHIGGTPSEVRFGVSKSGTTLEPQQELNTSITSAAVSGVYSNPVTSHGLFSVPKGFTTFHMLANWTLGAGTVSAPNRQLTAVFIPSPYGDVPDPTSDCCSAHAGTGCDVPVCEVDVCAADPFCCATEWDGACSIRANEICTVCAD